MTASHALSQLSYSPTQVPVRVAYTGKCVKGKGSGQLAAISSQ